MRVGPTSPLLPRYCYPTPASRSAPGSTLSDPQCHPPVDDPSALPPLAPFARALVGMDIAPCSAFDLAKRTGVQTTALIVSARLDPERLKESLCAVVERRFPRAGARLGKKYGVYAFHVPAAFDVSTPAVAFTTAEYNEPYGLPAAGRPVIPFLADPALYSGSKPAFMQSPGLREYLISPTCPTSPAGFTNINTPLLHVHVARFSDLTLVGLTYLEMLCDAYGLGMLLRAWTRVLAGEDLAATEGEGKGMDWNAAPFSEFCDYAPADTQCPRGYGFFWAELHDFLLPPVLWAVNWVSDTLRRDETRLVRVPKAFVERIRKEWMEGVTRHGTEGSKGVVSEDMLMAWWWKTSYSCTTREYEQEPVCLHTSVDLRTKHVVASELEEPYINNASATIPLQICLKSVQEMSVGELAQRIRGAIKEYHDAEPAKFERELRWREANPGVPLLRCPPGYHSSLMTDWRETGLGALDFSGASVRCEKSVGPWSDSKSEEGSKVRVVGVSTETLLADKWEPKRVLQCGTGAILMEDEHAIWMSQIKSKREWRKLERCGVIDSLSAREL
ncbi:hypothetical protein C8R47DRAFT_1328108 [Mycena vitilis]|nr:hypothetical protein C8R47DRAFT_1328108 [Mycena vitilis]